MLLKVLSNHLKQGRLILIFLSLTGQFFTAHATKPPELSSLINNTNLIEDKYGFMWLVGQSGLLRYDGSKVHNLSTTLHSPSVPFIWTHDIESNGDNILVSTETRGVWLIDSYTGLSTQLPIDVKNYSVYYATAFNDQYYIYTSTPDNIYKFDPKTSQTDVLQSGFSITDFIKTSSHLYLYTKRGLYQIVNEKVKLVKSGNIKAATSNKDQIAFSIDKELFIYEGSKQVNQINLASSPVSIAFDNTGETIFIIDDNNKITRLNQGFEPLEHNFIKELDAQTYKLYHDKSGALWAITSQGTSIITEFDHTNHKRTFDVRFNSIEVAEYEGQVIIGSYGAGLHTLESSNLFPVDINDSLVGQAKIITDLQVFKDSLYIATFNGLWKYDFKNKTINQVNLKNNNQIILKLSLHDESLYISTDSNGILIVNTQTLETVKEIDESFSLSSHEVIDTLPINNNLWLATSEGINVLDVLSNKIERIELKGSSKVISLVYADDKVFAFTNGDGVFVYNQNKELLSHFASNVNFTYSKLINGIIWAPSRSGLYQIDPYSNQATIVSGTENYAFTGEPIKVENKIFIGHYGGVIELPVQQQQTYNSPIHISQTNVSGEQYLNTINVVAKSSNDVISFDVSSLDYRSGIPKQYQYKINNGIWHNVANNTLTLTGLSSGKYNIEIKGTNSLGQWSSSKAMATIEVAYPWYWTLQLRIIYTVTAICAVLYGLWLLFLRTNSITKVHQMLESDLKSKGKRALSISRSLKLSLNLLEKGNTPDARKVIEQSIETLELINKQKEPDNLYGNSLSIAIPYLSEHLNNKYHIKLHSAIEIDESKLAYELLSDIYKITYESITSSLLNSESKQYEVNIQEFKSKLWLTISDDEDSFAHFNSSITFNMAMYYVKKIAEKYNASVNTFDAIDDKGSQLVISFPLMSLS